MDSAALMEFMQRGLLLVVLVSLPAVVAAVIVGMLFALVQAATQLQDQTTATIFKLLAAAAAMALSARFVGSAVVDFADEIFRAGGFHTNTIGF